MNPFTVLDRQNLHHSQLFISDSDKTVNDLFDVFESNLKISTQANEFFFYENYDKFLIDDARKIFDLHLKKTPKDDLQVFVIKFNFITREAQNAILKMIEEPKPRTHFFIIAPSKNIFLETILSRVEIIDLGNFYKKSTQEAVMFLRKGVGNRIKYVSEFLNSIKKGEKTKQDALDLLSGLEVELEKKQKFESLKIVVDTRKYINLSGASVKILLENVALNV
jgi:DNA polymerase III gamma/tau subunit